MLDYKTKIETVHRFTVSNSDGLNLEAALPKDLPIIRIDDHYTKGYVEIPIKVLFDMCEWAKKIEGENLC